MKIGGLLIALATAGLFCCPVKAQNVLTNPGFETGAATGQNDVAGAPGWTSFNNVFTTSAPNPTGVGPHAGVGALKEFGPFTGNNASGVFQQFTSNPGDVWTMNGFGLNDSADPMQTGNLGTLKISFRNASNQEISGFDSNHIDTTTPQNVWTPMTVSQTSPPGTVGVQLFCLFFQPQFAGGSTFFDDVSASVVAAPEPGSIALLGIAGLMSLRRRRH
jgi:hypothetical protein